MAFLMNKASFAWQHAATESAGHRVTVKASAKQFVSALRPQDRLSLVLFADESTLVHDLTTRRESTLKAVDEYAVRGGTAYVGIACSCAT